MPQTTLLTFQDASGSRPLEEWLEELRQVEPKAYVKCLQRIQLLERSGYELRRPIADSLKKDGVHELRAKHGRVNYRILYFFCGQNICCLTHGFTKEGDVPPVEIDRAVRAKKLVERDQDRYTAEWGL